MQKLRSTFREHLHFIVVVTLLTLVMTFPTIVYIFKTDVFWLPTGSSNDVFIGLWDVWYGKQFLTGQVDRFYTDLMFYPEGVSLVFHPLPIPRIIVGNALQAIIPASNTWSVFFMLSISLSALSAYMYVLWLFKDKWIALVGSVIFGFSPHVVGNPNHIDIGFIATIPLVIYCFHRGVSERRSTLVVASGLIAGLTTVTSLYAYISILITLGIMFCAFTLSRWRDRLYSFHIVLIILVIAISSLWRIYPLLSDSQSLGAATEWHGEIETRTDLISNFVNQNHPVLGPLAKTFLRMPESTRLSETSYLGYVPLLLASIGVFNPAARRKMLPWAALCAIFLLLRLGSALNINGTVFPEVLLPKYYLNQTFPSIFQSFWEADHFMMGAILPLAVLSCFGMVTLCKLRPGARRPWLILVFVAVVAFEYYIPVSERTILDEQFAFLDWLATEEYSDENHLINLPMGRNSSKLYDFYPSLSGYPHAEGAISRTPDNAFDYIRANHLLNAWHSQQPVSCETAERDSYLSGLAQLEQDGFSHIVHHRGLRAWAEISESFRYVTPAYSDDFVAIYRLSDLRDSCTEELSARRSFTWAYADALQKSPILDERHGIVVIFPPTTHAGDHFRRYFRRFAQIDKTVVTIASDGQGKIDIQRSKSPDSVTYIDLERFNAVWLVNVSLEVNEEQSGANREWFLKQFKFCERFQEDERTTIDLYLKLDIPCSAMGKSSALELRYDDGVRLNNLSYDFESDAIRFFLPWTNNTKNTYGFSIQFFDEDRQKALQYDNVIPRQLLTVHEIDTTPLPEGIYSVQLIVYDFETRISQGGTLTETAERFERELDIARIEV